MCGIIGIFSKKDVVYKLLEGLKRLSYRGYDSAGLVVIKEKGIFTRLARAGKIENLINLVKNSNFPAGAIGIAHTRWATHGKPSEQNAHPHISQNIIVAHNGIVENYEVLKEKLIKNKYVFTSETDTEVITHLIHFEQKNGGNLKEIVLRVINQIVGTYSLTVMDLLNPTVLVGVCLGNPLVIGIGKEENFIASDQIALFPFTNKFIYLEYNDIVEITHSRITIFNENNEIVNRPEIVQKNQDVYQNKGKYRYYMKKEIHDQPYVITETINYYLKNKQVNMRNLENNNILNTVKKIQIIACGSSYNSGMIARHWCESLANIFCNVEYASEFRYKKNILIDKDSLFIFLSQSGETADTLQSLNLLKKKHKKIISLSICNVENSSLVRASDISLITKAGHEISVASTKAFTTQLIVLFLLIIRIGVLNGKISQQSEKQLIFELKNLPQNINKIFHQKDSIKFLANKLYKKKHILFIGRGNQYPIAIEGALKIKEITYIHAEGYAAGELKHGPLALIDPEIPVIALLSKNNQIEKLKSNIEEICARDGVIYIFADEEINFIKNNKNVHVISLPKTSEEIAPILYVIPLQLLSYYIALIKGNDIDQPRNLAKSVTVE
ncbi:glutamine--fructose-6-phosphate transaminase (isomerizing) [Candidatus Tachikawaea gelatinosa]|uniref:Glutamine--fructose-6-phosphate aminotransferase [isomerizing] n=1 Tax=Candidatus Tachikawaea gelatinosa TaxID=1410383 RepID=A0A090AKZ1_9ENTR|nr:glutamine--fructose-6-phosphate transaminase (isomerizing) [Candidatus Tachikawaea gelatinosa]BAP58274.1 glutamine--fructose-6-phosphate aminotransferase [Candidatus Tachikawaea gelatinosa]